MADYLYVNILNEGMIPWILERGPLFNYYTSYGVYELLMRDPRVNIELATKENIAQRRAEYAEKLRQRKLATQKPQMAETLPIEDKIVVSVEPKEEPVVKTVDKDSVDDELDNILDTLPDTKLEMETKIPDSEDTKEFKVYKSKQLAEMTKKQLKDILIERGYTKGPYAPKYHDHLDELVAKVKKTQQF